MEIQLPVKCSTVKGCIGAADSIFEEAINWSLEILDNKVVRFCMRGLLIVAGAVVLSLIMVLAGGIVFGSILSYIYGTPQVSEFTTGGLIGIPVGWFIIAVHDGWIKFVCKEG
jgi:hypothetical protein